MRDNTGENNPMYGKKHSLESRKKMSESSKGKNNSMYGKHHTDEVKHKISETLKKTLGRSGVEIVCGYCGEKFTVPYNRRHRKFCSRTCSSKYNNSKQSVKDKLSKKRIEAIIGGNSNSCGIISFYSFNGKDIRCDSNIERACLAYFESLGATSIRRSDTVIVYEIGGVTRRFLPDFEIVLNNEIYIVEAKSDITYNNINKKWEGYILKSKVKMEALKEYCNNNGFKFFWFTKELNRKYYDSL